MEQYSVKGMSCAACSARVEKAVAKVPGVTAVSVSLLTNSMGVEGTAAAADVVAAVEAAGYGASPMEKKPDEPLRRQQEDALKDTETPILRRRLAASVGFLALLMYFSMGHMMWGWPVPAFFGENHLAMGLLQLLLAALVMVINQKFFISGFKGLLHRAPNMDTLVAMGSMVSFVYSTVALFAMTQSQLTGDTAAVEGWMGEFYFETAAMIVTLVTVGKLLEARSKGRTTDALRSLMKLAPRTATVLRNGQEQAVPVEQVRIDDIFVVRPGESIPVDGIVLEGSGAVNESALTGESIPVDKAQGGPVSAATVNQSGFLRCRATRVGQDTTLSQIIKMVSDAAATKAPIAKMADKVSGVFVPAVLGISAVTLVIWLLVGQTVGFALARAIGVLVISCPCALGLATPVAIMVGNGVGAKNGILFKTAVSLEQTGRVNIVVLDKTGTITSGEPSVTDLVLGEGFSEEDLLQAALNLEAKSEHPLAKAVLRYAGEKGLKPEDCQSFRALPGNGLQGVCQGKAVAGGNAAFIGAHAAIPQQLRTAAEALSQEGKTPLYFSVDGRLAGVIAVADTIKEDSPDAIRQLQDMGIRVIMLTGDNLPTAQAIGRQAGVDQVIADVLPEGKQSVIRSLQEQGTVAMVGDGINDAPALTQAHVGIAIGAGTDVAIDAADVVLMKSRLPDVPGAIRLSRATLRTIHQNLFWAFFYNCIGIPLAAGAFIGLLGWKLNPMFGAGAMSLSSFCVVANALRLNLFDMHHPKHHKRSNKSNSPCKSRKRKAVIPMEKTMKIEGMMCGHCEARVKKTLEAIEGVDHAEVSHVSGTAVVHLTAPVSDEALKTAVEAQDYPVVDIR